jgi:hypothetical protein
LIDAGEWASRDNQAEAISRRGLLCNGDAAGILAARQSDENVVAWKVNPGLIDAG